MAMFAIFSGAVICWILWTLASLSSNYKAARRIGLPVIVSPVSSLNPLWLISIRTFPILPLLKSLPFGLGKWARCAYPGWNFEDKYELHKELGGAFTLVTPTVNEWWIADPDAAYAILSARKDFIKPALIYSTYGMTPSKRGIG